MTDTQSTLSKLEYLQRVPMFAEIRDNTQALQELVQMMKFQDYKAGQNIIVEGESGNELFFLISGAVSIFRKTADGQENFKVAMLNAKQSPFFGEGALLAADIRSATVSADSTCTCLILSRENFDIYCSKNPAWGLPILKHVSDEVMRRLRKVNNDLVLLYRALIEEIRGEA